MIAKQTRVVIIGAGFGGIQAARALRNRPEIDVLLIDRNNYHLFQPLLYQVATASQNKEAIAHPIRNIIQNWRNVRFVLAEVTGIDTDSQMVNTIGGNYSYDYLILAAGAVTNYFGNDKLKERAFDLKRLEDSVDLRNQILTMFERASQEVAPEERCELLTFVVVGAGPTGVEFSGALAELVNLVLEKDYHRDDISRDEISIKLLEGRDNVLPPFSSPSQKYTQRRLEKMGVEVLTDTLVTSADEHAVYLKTGEVIRTQTVLWAAGVKASPLANAIQVEKQRGGRIPVNTNLTVPEHDNVYAIGDLTYLEQDGKPLPGVAQTAMQMGEYAGKHIIKQVKGAASKPFRYFDKGQMAVIGRGKAVAEVAGMNFNSVIAWLVWLFVHIFYLIGFQNRLVVMLNWGFDYLLFERKLRIIDELPEKVFARFGGADGEEALKLSAD